MGQQPSLNFALRQHIYNRDNEGLTEFLRSHEGELSEACMDEAIYVELIGRQWDSDTIHRFAKFANDKQLAVLIATAILQSHVVPLAPLFGLMRDRERTIEQCHLKHLFLIACERENVDAVRAFIANRCFDPSDRRPVRAVLRAQLSKSVVNEELVKLVLAAHPLQTDNVEYIRNNCLAAAKSDQVRKAVDDFLFNYIP
ncbi:uncharacterized protein Tco025E_00444 [Trypanosoma conorhini]|uniref:Uncharacterized protein n=1 Tax=Trypanosoma conorhini TaxID=83891 RepID=A0A3R7LF94_9TRYP|nr:uncharacterized protein Tco025E_00444 [Trypanosoma conorhini]RNF27253.1 hypothetical protein Tco025E_00444 [Trypanosoma conorhini]